MLVWSRLFALNCLLALLWPFALNRLLALLRLFALLWPFGPNRSPLFLLLLRTRSNVHQIGRGYRGKRTADVIADATEGAERSSDVRKILKERVICIVDVGTRVYTMYTREPEKIAGGKLVVDI